MSGFYFKLWNLGSLYPFLLIVCNSNITRDKFTALRYTCAKPALNDRQVGSYFSCSFDDKV